MRWVLIGYLQHICTGIFMCIESVLMGIMYVLFGFIPIKFFDPRRIKWKCLKGE